MEPSLDYSPVTRRGALPHTDSSATPSLETDETPQTNRGSAGDLGGAGLPDHGHLDLTGVGQLVLELLGDVAGEDLRRDVVDLVGLDHHAYVAAGLHRVDLLHPGVRGGDLLEP